MLHAPKEKLDKIQSILPGVEKPTILPVAHEENNVELQMVSTVNLCGVTLEAFKDEGARSILFLHIELLLK